jgi:hypothetical protein
MEVPQSKADVVHMEEEKDSTRGAGDKLAEIESQRAHIAGLKLDKHGLPLIPQPTDRKDDPLVC